MVLIECKGRHRFLLLLIDVINITEYIQTVELHTNMKRLHCVHNHGTIEHEESSVSVILINDRPQSQTSTLFRWDLHAKGQTTLLAY